MAKRSKKKVKSSLFGKIKPKMTSFFSNNSEPEKFSDINIDGHKVKTTANFILQLGIAKVKELVREFVSRNHKIYEFNSNIFVTDCLEKIINGKKIYLINLKNKEGIVYIICDTFDHLMAVGGIKDVCLFDGQNKMKKTENES